MGRPEPKGIFVPILSYPSGIKCPTCQRMTYVYNGLVCPKCGRLPKQ